MLYDNKLKDAFKSNCEYKLGRIYVINFFLKKFKAFNPRFIPFIICCDLQKGQMVCLYPRQINKRRGVPVILLRLHEKT